MDERWNISKLPKALTSLLINFNVTFHLVCFQITAHSVSLSLMTVNLKFALRFFLLSLLYLASIEENKGADKGQRIIPANVG